MWWKLAIAVFISTAGAGVAPASVPRFALEPGLELRYAVRAGYWFDGKDGTPDIPREEDGSPKYERSEIAIYVLNPLPNGSFAVVMQGASLSGSTYLTLSELDSTGRLTLLPHATPLLESDSLRAVFPRLPTSEAEQSTGWEDVQPGISLQMRFSQEAGTIKAEFETPLAKVSLGRETVTYRLDPETQLPAEVTTESRYDRYKETHSILVTAKDRIRHDAEWTAAFTRDATTYFEALEAWRRFQRGNVARFAIAERDEPGTAGQLWDAQRVLLIAARDAVSEPLFRDRLNELVAESDSERDQFIKSAQRWGTVAGLPTEWDAADLDGKPHSRQQYSGRVIVLDFWFRQCSFCIRAMPQVEAAAAEFRAANAPVTFFGVSIDEQAADAKFVAETVKLTYPVLHSAALAEQLTIKGYPTLIVISPSGTVEGIFIGYSPTLQEELTACIRGLLK